MLTPKEREKYLKAKIEQAERLKAQKSLQEVIDRGLGDSVEKPSSSGARGFAPSRKTDLDYNGQLED